MILNVCRACMCPLENCFKIINIFDNKTTGKLNVALMLTDLFKVKININDEITTNVCQLCADKIADLHQFYLMYMENHRKLCQVMKILQKSGSNELYLNSLAEPSTISTAITSPYTVQSDGNEEDDPLAIRAEEQTIKWECFKCHKIYSSFASLQFHSRRCSTHSNRTAPEPCDICNQSKLSEHVRKNGKKLKAISSCKHKRNRAQTKSNKPPLNTRTFTCKLCSITFATLNERMKHIDRIHKTRAKQGPKPSMNNYSNGIKREPSRKHFCQCCGKQFARINNLRIHLKDDHAVEAPFTCTTCHKRYFTKRELEIHRCLHEEQGRFVCDVCDNRFYSSGCLTRHMRTMHTHTQ